MAKAACLKFALCLLAVALATAPQVAFAEEAQAKSDHQAAPEGKGEAAKGDHGSKGDHGKGEGPTGRDANSPQPKAGESDRVDTHIDAHTETDAPHLPLRRDDDRGQRVEAEILSRRQRSAASGAGSPDLGSQSRATRSEWLFLPARRSRIPMAPPQRHPRLSLRLRLPPSPWRR